jgi:hypothetical protein
MKASLKNKSSAITASILVAAFFLLHLFVYIGFYSGDVPVLESYTDSSVDVKKLSLCEEKRPTYFNPFRKITYIYQEKIGDTSGECNIIEQAESMFTSKMQPLVGNPQDYHMGEDGGDGLFLRPLVGNTYANLFFFIIQYCIIATFVFVLLKPEKSK